MREPQREEYTIMFADVADSTGLYERLGDIEAQFTISQCLGLVKDLVERNKGTVIKTAGDDIMCMFDKSYDAIVAASSIQEALVEEMVFDDLRIAMHIGIHSGLGLITEGDVFGDTVNVAARVCSAAKSEQILTTRESIERLPPDYEVETRPYDKVQVKGRAEPVEMFEIMWQGSANATISISSDSLDITGMSKHLQIRNCGQEFELTPDSGPFVIGRDLDCNLTINGTMISRQHAVIEFRRNKFILRDQSTNGTYLRPAQGQPFYIRREEIPLTSEGEISLGKLVDDRPALNIFYRFV
ncbi:MAG: adenylate/guanylate cyclase domain-containing protein [Thiotrichales bacterium]